MKRSIPTLIITTGMLFLLAGCGSEKSNETAAPPADAAASAIAPETPAAAPTAPTAAPAADAATPAPGGQVVTVLATMEADGTNHFKPNKLTVKRGDVIRVQAGEGVHNFHIVKGPAGVTLPPPSVYLTTPGQTVDIPVDLAAGEYDFQCDPHAALGMVGTLTVTE